MKPARSSSSLLPAYCLKPTGKCSLAYVGMHGNSSHNADDTSAYDSDPVPSVSYFMKSACVLAGT
eukprot:scaffold2315_cov145-Isochrysis_galbana.AAC.4